MNHRYVGRLIGIGILFLLLTVVTQIGGIVLLGWIPIARIVNKKLPAGPAKRVIKPLSFIGLYLVTSLILVPPAATFFGRVPLPVSSRSSVQPLTLWTCLLNRHYVKPELKQTVEKVARQMDQVSPGTQVAYLDANFPFIDKFPLFPHLSHNDGKKLDLAFFYRDATSGEPLNAIAPSFIGYGVCEEPRNGEVNTPLDCANRGYWQYSFLQYLVTQLNKEKMPFDAQRTRILLNLLVEQAAVSKVFIEPHLKTRLNLQSSKIRFHGCQAVRHDDHIHLQIK